MCETWIPVLNRIKTTGFIESYLGNAFRSHFFVIQRFRDSSRDARTMWLTFQFGAGDRIHVEGDKLKKPMWCDGDGRDLKQSAELFKHLNRTRLKRFHPEKRILCCKTEEVEEIIAQLTRFELSAFLEHGGRKSQIVCLTRTDPFDAALRHRCFHRCDWSWKGQVELFGALCNHLQDESKFPCASSHRIDVLSPSNAVDSSPPAFAG